MTSEREFRLLGCNSLAEFMTMFFGLGQKEKLSIFTENILVKKNSFFYRIRSKKGIDDPNDPKQWGPVPARYAKQGRFNADKESVLYVASASDYLEREVRLKEGEEYYLAKYICKNTFNVGSFLGVNNQVNTLIHKIAMAVSCNQELTENENMLIGEYFKEAQNKNLEELSLDLLASLYIFKLLPNLYDYTNKLGKLIMAQHECGIRYSSVYVPIEFSGASQILTLDGEEYGNYVLSQKGYENLELVSVEKRTATKTQELDVLITEFMKAAKEDKI